MLEKESTIENEKETFFDNNTKQFISSKMNMTFEDAIEWAKDIESKVRLSNQNLYPNKKSYQYFFLMYIFRMRDTLEILWKKYCKFATKGFRKNLLTNAQKFNQYLWEMYLTIGLEKIASKINRNKRNNGPDIEIEYKYSNYYIECVAPTQGKKYDNYRRLSESYLPSMKINFVGKVPLDKARKRIFSSLKSKAEAYKKYSNKKNINKKYKKVIALNTSCLSQYGTLLNARGDILIDLCKNTNFFETYPMIDYIIINHKSIFDYNDELELEIIDKYYSKDKISIKI